MKPECKISSDGRQEWWLNGERHREDGPAVIYPDGDQFWYLNGNLHRRDGPAVIYPNGSQYWLLNGKLHRENGPAIITNSSKVWAYHDYIHRFNGPAVISTTHSFNGNYFIYGYRMLKKQYLDIISRHDINNIDILLFEVNLMFKGEHQYICNDYYFA